MNQQSGEDPIPPSEYLWLMMELTAWIGVGFVFVTLAWGSLGLVRELSHRGPWGWVGAVVVALVALVGAVLSAVSYLWYLYILPHSWNELNREPQGNMGSIAVAVVGSLLIISLAVGAAVLWLRWESPWRWLVLVVLSSMLVSNGISNGFHQAKYGVRR